MRVYRYLYYRLFRIWQNKKNERNAAHINAIISVSFLVCINVVSIPLVLMALFSKDIITFPEIHRKWPIFLAVILFGVIQYYLLAYKNKHLQIVKEFEGETNNQRQRSTFFTWLYMILSIGIPLYIFFFTTPR